MSRQPERPQATRSACNEQARAAPCRRGRTGQLRAARRRRGRRRRLTHARPPEASLADGGRSLHPGPTPAPTLWQNGAATARRLPSRTKGDESDHESCPDPPRPPAAGRSPCTRPCRADRRTGPAGRVVGFAHLAGGGPSGQGPGRRAGCARRAGGRPGRHGVARLRPAVHLVRCVQLGVEISCPSTSGSPAEEVSYIVGHCGADILLIDPELEEQHPRARARAST